MEEGANTLNDQNIDRTSPYCMEDVLIALSRRRFRFIRALLSGNYRSSIPRPPRHGGKIRDEVDRQNIMLERFMAH